MVPINGTAWLRGAKFTKNKNDQWSSAARVSVSKCTNPWYMTYSVLPFTIMEPRQVCLNCAGLWLRVVWAFPDSPNTTGWPPVVFQGLAPMDQLSKSRTKTNLQAKYRTPRMPLAARRWFSEGSKSRSQKTWQCVQVMFKAKKHIYKKHGFSKFDHATMRKKTHQNELDGWKHDGWALASGYKHLSFLISLGIWVNPVALSLEKQFWDRATITSTVAFVWFAGLGWLPQQTKLLLHTDGWRRTRERCQWPWNVKSRIRKAEPGRYLQLCSFTVLHCTISIWICLDPF